MIIYLFNHYYPDSSGFGRRCEREIEALSTIDNITVVCRKNVGDLNDETLKRGTHSIRIVRYDAHSEIVHRPEGYKSNGFYEIKRNLDINIAQVFTLIKIFRSIKDQKKQLYCVTSPLTVPLTGWVISRLLGVEPRVVSFHDLEPELAMHMKGLNEKSWLVRLEFWLEAFVVHHYKKVVVTSEGQAEKLIERTHINRRKIVAIPNSTDITKNVDDHDEAKLLPTLAKGDFVLMYLTTLSFGYTIDGFLDFLRELKAQKKEFPHLKVVIAGGGEALPMVQDFIKENDLADQVYCLGPVKNPASLLKRADAGLIPWKQDIMTSTMLPTKLFEYLSLGVPVIAPNYGEFKRVLSHMKNAFLFNDTKQSLGVVNQAMVNLQQSKQVGIIGKELYLKSFHPNVLNTKFLEFYTAQ